MRHFSPINSTNKMLARHEIVSFDMYHGMMLKVLVFLILYTRVNAQCEGGWKYYKETHSCFQLFRRTGDFYDSDTFCNSQGGHLAILKTRGETELVKDMMTVAADHTWIGLSAPTQDCNFLWLDGSPINKSVITWMIGEPSSCRIIETCAHIRPEPLIKDRSTLRLLNDNLCGRRLNQMVCGKPASPLKVEVAKPCEKGWSFYEETKSCFKHYVRSANFDEANAHCKSFGSYLASITTTGEREFVKQLIQTGRQKRFEDETTIGLTAFPKSCDFRWMDGTPLNKSVVSWNYKEPNFCAQYQFCAQIDVPSIWRAGPLGILDDSTCSRRYNKLLCKKNATVEEKVVCKSGWVRLEGTATCIEDSTNPRKNVKNPDEMLKSKCLALSKRSYFDEATSRCFVKSTDCYSIVYPEQLIRNPDYYQIRRELESVLLLDRSSQLCVFGREERCRTNEKLRGGRCFWLSSEKGSWSSASNDCQKNEGTLFVPHDDRDMQTVLNYMSSEFPDGLAVWIGLVKTDNWNTIDGSKLDYVRWIPQNIGTLGSSVSAAVFLSGKPAEHHGSFNGYMQVEKDGSSFLGLCSR